MEAGDGMDEGGRRGKKRNNYITEKKRLHLINISQRPTQSTHSSHSVEVVLLDGGMKLVSPFLFLSFSDRMSVV